MNRGSRGAAARDSDVLRASMRPRFMNRGSECPAPSCREVLAALQ